MTPSDLASIAESVYGPEWVSPLARELVREVRTVRRWKSGESPVPQEVQKWLRKRRPRSPKSTS